jgi:glycyl-tRNA synthetase
MFFTVISHAYTEEKVDWEGSAKEERVVLKLPPALSPVQLAVLPLVRKDGLPEKAREIIDRLKYEFNCQYEEKDSIGKRYRRQDAIGTPFCITIDHQTTQDNTVTIRYRDTMQQERIVIDRLPDIMRDKVSLTTLLRNL